MSDYRLSWKVEHQHSCVLTEAELRALADDLNLDGSGEIDLDEIYEALDRGDWRAEEALLDLASDRNWVDNGDCEVTDLEEIDSSTPQLLGEEEK